VSAADKATARDAATQGIQDYREGKYAEALDLLKRAQALYDAPVHQHYIARCQRELGSWIEAAEGFRALSHRQLDSSAPPQWQDAVTEAGRELSELEPRIPRLLIRVEPKSAEVSRLAIDDVEVPNAVIGMERLANPGTHHITLAAKGYRDTEQTVEAKAGESTEVKVVLERADAAKVVAPAGSASNGGTKDEGGAETPKKEKEKGRYELLFGLRLGAAVPGGKVPAEFARPSGQGDPVDISDVAGNGGNLELRGGISGPLHLGFIERWGAHLFVSGGSLAGKTLAGPGTPLLQQLGADGNQVTTTPNFVSGGVALTVGHARDHFGAFIELGLVAHSLTLDYTTSNDVLLCRDKATAQRGGSGAGARASAGVGIPVWGWGLLTPYVAFSVESMRTLTFSSNDCFAQLYQQAGAEVPADRENLDAAVTHSFFGVGIGGEAYIGL
jgi:hypothetical protein